MFHGFLEVTLQPVQHEVKFHGFHEVTLEPQEISHDRVLTSMVSMVHQGSHMHEKYLNIQDCLEKYLKIKFALKST